MKNKAQIWSIDFFVGFIIFLIVIFISIKMVTNIIPSTQFDVLYSDAVHLSSSLIGTGSPDDWNGSTVIIPGLADNNRLNLTKLANFDNISYQSSKVLFHTSNDYLFFFTNKTSVMNISKCVRGHSIPVNSTCWPQIENLDISNLIKFERIMIVNSTISTLVIYMWN